MLNFKIVDIYKKIGILWYNSVRIFIFFLNLWTWRIISIEFIIKLSLQSMILYFEGMLSPENQWVKKVKEILLKKMGILKRIKRR